MSKGFKNFLVWQLSLENKHEYSFSEINPQYDDRDDIILKFDRYIMRKTKIATVFSDNEIDGIIIEKTKAKKKK